MALARHQQKTAKTVSNLRYAEITHGAHRYYGQTLRIIRQTRGDRADGHRRWVLELPDGGRITVPLSWAREDGEDDSLTERSGVPAGPIIDASGLQQLRQMVDHVLAKRQQEVNQNGEPNPAQLGERSAGSDVGGTVGTTTASRDMGADGTVGETTAQRNIATPIDSATIDGGEPC